jgi:2-oxoacid:acceptor oxidoreductase delta subunit (pyruvate/2-ketoisovalerate family)
MMTSVGCTNNNPGSTVRNKTGSWRTFKPVSDREKCVECFNCYLFCPEGCIDTDFNIDYDFCKGCGICKNECPVNAIDMEIDE